jgi:uncharacterized protein
MLRGGLFVDLHAVVKHSLRASVERYSIKDLEPFYGFIRSVALTNARANLRVIERALELGTGGVIPADVRTAVQGYNRDDCLSALRLRSWLEKLRGSVEANGTTVPRPVPRDNAAPRIIRRKVCGDATANHAVAADDQDLPRVRATVSVVSSVHGALLFVPDSWWFLMLTHPG